MDRAWRILIADDDAEMRAWLRVALRGLADRIEELPSGLALLESVARDHLDIDAVITDVRMPGPDGLKVVAMARTAGLETPVLVITAFPEPAVAETVGRLGRTALLAKPFDAEALHAALRDLLSDRDRR